MLCRRRGPFERRREATEACRDTIVSQSPSHHHPIIPSSRERADDKNEQSSRGYGTFFFLFKKINKNNRNKDKKQMFTAEGREGGL